MDSMIDWLALAKMRARFEVQRDRLMPTFPAEFTAALENELAEQETKPRQSTDSLSRDTEHSLAEVTRLQIKINRLLDDMKILGAKIQKSTAGPALATPIHRLPPEVLAQVFSFVLPEMAFPRRVSSPLALSHVCLNWRNVSLASTRLWNRLSLDVFRFSKPRLLSSLIPFWFGRAGNIHPLSFSLANHISLGGVADAITQSIIPYVPRFCNLRFETVSLRNLRPLLSLASGSLRILETLVLDAITPTRDTVPLVITVFNAASCLQRATLGLPLHTLFDDPRFVFPWNQLTNITVTHTIPLHTFSNIIFKCPHIQSASFILSSREDLQLPDPVVPVFPLTFPGLAIFKLRLLNFWDPAGLTDVLSMLDMPALHTLSLESNPSSCAFPIAAIQPRRREDLGLIRTLEVLSHLDIEEELFDLISACPLVERLVLRAGRGTAQVSILQGLRIGNHPARGIESRLALSHLTYFGFQMIARQNLKGVAEEFFLHVLSRINMRWGALGPWRRSALDVVALGICDPRGDEETLNAIHDAFHYLRRGFEPLRGADRWGRPPVDILLITQVLGSEYEL
ncbi:hypothetical protein FPV67DRAFT_628738 [Lyophyllum atratum]|nr:hypothetical protein FPV67DRAFT_628738 [Lyophyllum atratum]